MPMKRNIFKKDFGQASGSLIDHFSPPVFNEKYAKNAATDINDNLITTLTGSPSG